MGSGILLIVSIIMIIASSGLLGYTAEKSHNEGDTPMLTAVTSMAIALLVIFVLLFMVSMVSYGSERWDIFKVSEGGIGL